MKMAQNVIICNVLLCCCVCVNNIACTKEVVLTTSSEDLAKIYLSKLMGYIIACNARNERLTLLQAEDMIVRLMEPCKRSLMGKAKITFSPEAVVKYNSGDREQLWMVVVSILNSEGAYIYLGLKSHNMVPIIIEPTEAEELLMKSSGMVTL